MPKPVPALFLLWLTAVSLACGGKAVIDGEPTDGDGGSTSDPRAGVMCGSAGSCTFDCCLDLTQEDGAPFCATNCGNGVSAFRCDGPEDCDGGSCCGDILGTTCKPSCDFSDLELCHDDEHCEVGFCSEALISGVSFDTCMR